jgi:hypothetical protein
MRPLSILALLVVVAVAAGCGGGDKDTSSAAAPGTPKNPLVATVPSSTTADDQAAAQEAGIAKSGKGAKTAARTSHPAPAKSFSEADAAAGTSTDPGYQKLLEQQTHKPRSRFTPCNLVRRSEAAAILGAPVQPLIEAPQGPTCIYRTAKSRSFITVSVERAAISKLRKQLRHSHQVAVAERSSVCGTIGRPLLYVPVSSARVLVVTAPCQVARRFASAAVGRIPAEA